ncbi:hypothetical protein Tco_1367352 [Tanacetum coccineum]
MFRDILHLPVETPENPFVAPVNIETIEALMNRVSYQGVIDKEIRVTDEFKKYETVFINVDVPMNQPQPIVSTQGTHRSTPRAHRTPTLTASAKVDDTRSKIEPESQKENSERVSDDDETEKEKEVAQDIIEKETEEVGIEHNIVEKEVEDETNVKPERTEEVVKETEVANVSGSQETRNEQTQTPISSPIRSPGKVSFSDKTVLEDFACQPGSRKSRPDDNIRIQLSIFIQKTSSSTTTTSSVDLQQQLYLNMKIKPQDQAADPKIWEILKAKSENP